MHVIIGPGRQIARKTGSTARKVAREEADFADSEETLLLLSAQCRDGLTTLAQRYADLLEDENRLPAAVSVEAIANAVAHGRDLLPERLAVSASRRDDLAGALRSFIEGVPRAGYSSATAVTRSAKTAFVFSGNGAQWAGMGRHALKLSRQFRHHFAQVERAYSDVSGVSLDELIHADDLVHQIVRTEVAQPLLFAIQVALAKCLMERGLQPAALIGHSVGEVAAAHISGALESIRPRRSFEPGRTIRRSCAALDAWQLCKSQKRMPWV